MKTLKWQATGVDQFLLLVLFIIWGEFLLSTNVISTAAELPQNLKQNFTKFLNLIPNHEALPKNHKHSHARGVNSPNNSNQTGMMPAKMWTESRSMAPVFEYSNNLTRSMPKAKQEYHIIEVNGSSLDASLDPMSSSESKPSAAFSYQSTMNLEPMQQTSSSSGPTSRKPDKTNGSSNNGRLANFMQSLKESANNNKLLLIDYPSSTTERPKLSQRSQKFLQEIKNKRRASSQRPQQSIGSTPSPSRPPPPPLPPLASLATEKNSSDSSKEKLAESASYTHEKWISFDAADEDQEEDTNLDAAVAPQSSNLETAEAAMNLESSNQGGLQVEKRSREQEREESPARSKSVKMTTISGGPDNKRFVIKHEPGSKSDKLPAKLRQKIIDQFIKNGGDPQNIIVTDSTITTTSKSKKKTVTTVYKIVPTTNNSNTNKWPHSPESLHDGKTRSLMFDDDHDNDDAEDDNHSSSFEGPKFGPNPKKKPQAKVFKNLRAIKPKRKLKKIMVTRIEIPEGNQSYGSKSGSYSKLDGSGDKQELGEFYRGPDTSIFGLNENLEKFSNSKKDSISDLNKVIQVDQEKTVQPDELNEQTHKMMEEQNYDLNEIEKTAEFKSFDKPTNDEQQLEQDPAKVRKFVGSKIKKSPSKAKAITAASVSDEHEPDTKSSPNVEDSARRSIGKTGGKSDSDQARSRNRQLIDEAVARTRKLLTDRKQKSSSDQTSVVNENADESQKESLDGGAENERRLKSSKTTNSKAKASKGKDPGRSKPKDQSSGEAMQTDDPSREESSDFEQDQPTTTSTRRPTSRRHQAAPSDSLVQLKRAVESKMRPSPQPSRSSELEPEEPTKTTPEPQQGPGEEKVQVRGKSLKKITNGKTRSSRPKISDSSIAQSSNSTTLTTQTPETNSSSSHKDVERATTAQGSPRPVASSTTVPPTINNQVDDGTIKNVNLTGGFQPSSAPSQKSVKSQVASEASASAPTSGASNATSQLAVNNQANQVAPQVSSSPDQAPHTHNIMMLIDFDSANVHFTNGQTDGATRGQPKSSQLLSSGISTDSQQWRPLSVATSSSRLKQSEGTQIETARALGQSDKAPTVSVSIYNNLAEVQQQQQHQRRPNNRRANQSSANRNFNHLKALQSLSQQQLNQLAADHSQLQNQELRMLAKAELHSEPADYGLFASTNQFDQPAGPASFVSSSSTPVGTPLNNYVIGSNFTSRQQSSRQQSPALLVQAAPTSEFHGHSQGAHDPETGPFLYVSGNNFADALPATATAAATATATATAQQRARLISHQQVPLTGNVGSSSLLPDESVQTNRMIQMVIDEIAKSALANGYQVENRTPVSASSRFAPSYPMFNSSRKLARAAQGGHRLNGAEDESNEDDHTMAASGHLARTNPLDSGQNLPASIANSVAGDDGADDEDDLLALSTTGGESDLAALNRSSGKLVDGNDTTQHTIVGSR